jgi:NAD(P)-dependent dehydrogenase (short-subunit alcohol dehydrogenase family)
MNDMLMSIYGEERLQERKKTIPLGRLAAAPEVASMAVFLASKEAEYITGQTFVLDGGASAAGCYTMEVFKRAKQPA